MLHVRSIAISAAVLCFFVVGIVGSLCGLSPSTCCRRAALGAVAACFVVGMGVRAINAILTEAMIDSEISKGNAGESKG